MAEFDIERFIQLAGPVQVDDLDLEECARIGVTDAEARILRYMADTETHTILYMRDLLAGYTARDPEITQFLSVWVYEELWHGRAIDMVLTAAGRPPPKSNYTEVTTGASIREMVEGVLSQAAAYTTPRFVASHNAWGAINEWTAASAYMTLAKHTANPAVATLCRRMAKQERKHYAFYYQQAEKRLTGDRFAQGLARVVLQGFWTPVGSGVGKGDNLEFVAAHLFKDPADFELLAEGEETIRKLPGMGWFKMLTTQVTELIRRYEDNNGEAPALWSSGHLQKSAQPAA
jgi:rubrerythrin